MKFLNIDIANAIYSNYIYHVDLATLTMAMTRAGGSAEMYLQCKQVNLLVVGWLGCIAGRYLHCQNYSVCQHKTAMVAHGEAFLGWQLATTVVTTMLNSCYSLHLTVVVVGIECQTFQHHVDLQTVRWCSINIPILLLRLLRRPQT